MTRMSYGNTLLYDDDNDDDDNDDEDDDNDDNDDDDNDDDNNDDDDNDDDNDDDDDYDKEYSLSAVIWLFLTAPGYTSKPSVLFSCAAQV
jgi:hypothetical protein